MPRNPAQLPPINTAEGRTWIDRLIEKIGEIDFIVFDNLQALTAGDHRDTGRARDIRFVPLLQSRSPRAFTCASHYRAKNRCTRTRPCSARTVRRCRYAASSRNRYQHPDS